jgi:hypothetical protein
MASKGRSRNYPAFGLPIAIERLDQLYQKEGKSKTDSKTAVKAWGYGGLNGASLRVLSALRQYGLIEDSGEDIKVSDLGLIILHGTPKDRESALRVAATSPTIFAELLKEYGNEFPSNDTIRANLITRKGFNPSAADIFITALRDTMDLALPSSNDYTGAQRNDQEKGRFIDAAFNESLSLTDQMNAQLNSQQDAKHFIRVWSLTGGTAAKLEINAIPSKKDQEFLKLCLDRALAELKEIEEKISSPDHSPNPISKPIRQMTLE